jgi:hypothetical protein
MSYWTKAADEEPEKNGAKVEVMFENGDKKMGEVSISDAGSVFLLLGSDGKLWRNAGDEPEFWRYIE